MLAPSGGRFELRHFSLTAAEQVDDAPVERGKILWASTGHETIVFDHKEALTATEEVLSDNGVRQQASDDLLAVWKKK